MAAFLKLPPAEGFQYGTALFPGMSAPHKAAVVYIRCKFQEGFRQAAFQLQLQFRPVERGKSGSIYHLCPAGEAVQLHMASGVPSPAQSCADLSHLYVKLRVQSVQNTGFPYAGVACKGR